MVADPLAASRLPDLPSAGYSTRKQRELSDAIMFLIRGVERDRVLLLEIVLQGQKQWRRIFKSAYRAIGADDEFADAVFGYLVLLAGPNPAAQKAILEGQQIQQAQQQWDFRQRTKAMFRKTQRELHENIRKEAAEMHRRKPHSVS